MTNYGITLEDGNVLELPKYSMKIAKKLEGADKANAGQQSFEQKTKTVYDTLSDIIGNEKVVDIVGAWKDIDPNDVYLLYKKVVSAYNDPLESYDRAILEERMELNHVDKVVNMINTAEKAQRLK